MKRFPTALLLTLVSVGSVFPAGAETPESLRKKASAVLAQLEGEIKVPGLKEPVEVLRDRWGIPHIYAKNADDLFFAQGFVAAQDRLFQIDLWRRIGVGETAEMVGKSALEADRFARLLKYRGDPEAEWVGYAPDARRIATAFTRGINAYIDHIGDRLPIEFQLLGVRPKEWQPEDCLGRMSGIIMTRNFKNELARAELVAAVGVEKARRIAPTDPPRQYAPAPDLDLAGIDRSILTGYNAALKAPPFKLGGDGSNNWAVDGTLSASGKPLLASDPHRAIALPSLRYLVHLNAPNWNVIGSGEPGLPGVAIGHNERVAWGFTIVGTDQADLYVEETNPADAAEYRVGNHWEKMKIVRETVAVRGGERPVEMELRFTRHGPVISEDAKRHRAYALKWVGSEPGGAAYLASLALDRAKNGREFVAALKGWKVPSENMVYADVDGNIGWVAAALTPVRKGWDGLLPVPGAKGAYEWQGFLPLKELPQAHNPAAHYVATANHNILPAGYGAEIGYEWAPPYRFARVKERLEGAKKFTLEDFQSIQHDATTLPGRTLARLVKVVGVRDRELRPYVELLAGWDGVLSADSRAGALYGVWLRELLDGFYRPHVPAGLLDFTASRSGVPVMLAALDKPDEAWFGENPTEGRDRLLRTTFRKAVDRLRKLLPGDEKAWSWGRLHSTTFRHPLASLGPVYAKAFDLGPVPRAGDAHTPNAASHNAKFEHTGGATYRHVFDLADWDCGLATSAPGQSGQPGSPHHGDLLSLWQRGEYFPLAFSRAKVEQVTRHRLKLTPAGRSERLRHAVPPAPVRAEVPVNVWHHVERGDIPGQRWDVPLAYAPEVDRFLVLGGRSSWGEYHKGPRPYDQLAYDVAEGRWENWFPRGKDWGPRFGPCKAPAWKDERFNLRDADGNARPNWTVYGTFSLGTKYDYDSDTKSFVFYAGGRTFRYDPAERSWTDLVPKTHPEKELGGVLLWGSMCYDRHNKRFVLFGGGNVQTERGDPGTWTYTPATNAWERLNLDRQPPQRANSRLVYDRGAKKVVLFGGDALDHLLADTWAFDVVTNRWEQRKPNLSPSPRAGHALLWLPKAKKVLLVGGYGYTSATGYVEGLYRRLPFEMWTYDTMTDAWELLTHCESAKFCHQGPVNGFLPAAVGDTDLALAVGVNGTWTCTVAANTTDGEGTAKYGVKPGTTERRTGPHDPAWYCEGVPPADPAKTAKELKELPANTWVQRPTPKLPRPNMDWGSAVFAPELDLIVRFSGGHSAYSGTAPQVYNVKADRWSIPFTPEYPIEYVYSNDQVHGEWSFRGNPWMTGHTYKATGYDPSLRTLVFVPHEYSYFFDPKAGQWSRGPERNPYRPNFYINTVCATPQGAVVWADRRENDGAGLWRLDAESRRWKPLPLKGELPPKSPDHHGLAYDAKRERLIFFSDLGKTRGDVTAYDLRTGEAKRLSASGKEAAAIPSRETAYLPEVDAVLVGAHVELDGKPLWPLYDCARNAWFGVELAGTDPVGKGRFNNSMGLMYDPGRKLVWAVGQNGRLFVLRLDTSRAKLYPLR